MTTLSPEQLSRLAATTLDPCPECGSDDVSIIDYSDNLHECGACGTQWDSTTIYPPEQRLARRTASFSEGQSVYVYGSPPYTPRKIVKPLHRNGWGDEVITVSGPPGEPDRDVTPGIVVTEEQFHNGWHVYLGDEIIAGGGHITQERAEEIAREEGGVVRQGSRKTASEVTWTVSPEDSDVHVSEPINGLVGIVEASDVVSTTADYDLPTRNTWLWSVEEDESGRTVATGKSAFEGSARQQAEEVMRDGKKTGSRLSAAQLQSLALGEQRAPAEVDTLRDESCPVCGSVDYRGSTCAACGYAKSPVIFHDPNVEKAKSTDLRTPTAPVDLACDSCGAVYPAPSGGVTASRKVADTIPSPPPLPGQEDTEEPVAAAPAEEEAPTTTNNPAAPSSEHERGDVCPSCGQGTLLPKDEVDGVEAEEVEGFDSEGDPVEDVEEDVEEPGEGGEDADSEIPDVEDEEGDEDTEDEGDEDAEEEFDEDDSEDEDSEDDLSEDEDDPEEGVRSPGKKSRTSQKEQSMTTRQTHAFYRGEKTASQEEQPGPRRRLHAALAEQGRTIQAQASQIRRQAAAQVLMERDARVLRDAVVALARQTGNRAVVAALDPRWANAAENNDDVALTDETAAAPEAKTDLESEQTSATDSVTPDATTDVESDAVALDTKPLNELVDVTEEHTDTGETTGTTTDHTGPAKTAPEANDIADSGWKTSSAQQGERTWAAMHLAKMRKSAGLTEEEPTLLAQRLAADESLSMDSMETEIRTLKALASRQEAAAPSDDQRRHLVPRSASQAPSLAGGRTASASSDDVSLDDTIM